jgi:hypothetical protein
LAFAVLFLVTGSAGSGKSAAVRDLSARALGLVAVDTDDWHAPADDRSSWWEEQIEECVEGAIAREAEGTDTVLVGWTSPEELRIAPSAERLGGLAACLLDCDDSIRVQRIEARAASGTWGIHRPELMDYFLRSAEEMRTAAGDDVLRIDTSGLTVHEVADQLEAWVIASRTKT